jgi:hypothetical protein
LTRSSLLNASGRVSEPYAEPGDLVGLGVDIDLAQDAAAGVVHRRQQVHRRGCVVAAAA